MKKSLVIIGSIIMLGVIINATIFALTVSWPKHITTITVAGKPFKPAGTSLYNPGPAMGPVLGANQLTP